MAPFDSAARKRVAIVSHKLKINDEEKIGWERHPKRVTKTADDADEILKLDKAIQRNDLTSALQTASELQELSEELDKTDAAYLPADECGGGIRAKTSARTSALDKEANKFLGEKPLAPITRGGGDAAIELWARERVSGFTRDPLTRKLVVKDGLASRSGYRRILPESRPAEDWHLEYQIEELEDAAKAVLREKNATIFEALVLDPLRGRRGKTVGGLARQFGRSAADISRIKHKCKIRVQAEIESRRGARALAAAPIQADETCGICDRTYGVKRWPRIRGVCKGQYGGGVRPTPEGLNPECLYALRKARWEKRLASITPEKRAAMEAKYRDMVAQREAESEAMRLRDSARWNAEYAAVRAEINAMYLGSEEMSESYDELWAAASSETDNLFELAIAAFRRVVAMQNTSLLPAFDSVANAARDAETNDAYWNAIEALWDVAKGDVKAALNRVIFDGPKE